MSAWELVFYETARGRRPVQEYLDGLSATEAARVVADLDLLASFGPDLGCRTSGHSGASFRSCARSAESSTVCWTSR